MGVNLDKPQLWKADVAASVDMYNAWFMQFAPEAFRSSRDATTKAVEDSLKHTNNMSNLTGPQIRQQPSILPTLRMSTCPPLAVDRLIGLAGVGDTLVKALDKKGRIPPNLDRADSALVDRDLNKIAAIIKKMLDPDIFVWVANGTAPTDAERHRAATIVADRLCGSVANPIVRNAQEIRQLAAIAAWLQARGYTNVTGQRGLTIHTMKPGTFSFRLNVQVKKGENTVNIPVDAVIMPKTAKAGDLPILIEAKSAGDFTNTNKRRKEEAQKMGQLRTTYGPGVQFVLFLCGYFDSGYLGYEAAEGIDWIWEHRIDDLAELGL